MTKTLALLLDSYRELNAKRLFWIMLVLSGFIVGAFAMIGLKGDTITVLWFSTPLKYDLFTLLDPASLYKSMFAIYGVNLWLAWLGNIFALASTAAIFPDFLAAGSIDLYLSKPISRLRLFLSKYIGGLLFVTLQVSVFSLCCFLLLGMRGHEWNPVIFLSIPLVTLVFSYLFSICVLIGVLTRSTIAALLLTLLIWLGIWGVQVTETALLFQSTLSDVRAASLDRQIAEAQKSLADPKAIIAPASTESSFDLPGYIKQHNPIGFLLHHNNREDLQNHLEQLESDRQAITSTAHTAHEITLDVLTVLPKTSGTTELLIRALSTPQEENFEDAFSDERQHRPGRRESFADRKAVRKAMQEDESRRTASWFICTSLGFEAVVLSLAAWLFCRRDY